MTVRKKKHGQTGLGYLYEASNAFHVRYYKAVVQDDGSIERVARSQRLCPKDAQHPNLTCKAVRDLRAEFMVRVNAEKPQAGDMPISAFWERFISHAEQK